LRPALRAGADESNPARKNPANARTGALPDGIDSSGRGPEGRASAGGTRIQIRVRPCLPVADLLWV